MVHHSTSRRRNILGAHCVPAEHVKLMFSSTIAYTTMVSQVQHGPKIKSLPEEFSRIEFFDGLLDPAMQMCVERGVEGASWISVPVGSYCDVPLKDRISSCSREVSASVDHVQQLPEDNALTDTVAPMLVTILAAVYCSTRQGDVLEVSSLLAITTVTFRVTEEARTRTNVFVIGETKCPDNVNMVSCSSERDLVRRWKDFFIKLDPDVVVTFDSETLGAIAQRVAVTTESSGDPSLGRICGHPCSTKKKSITTRAFGTQTSLLVSMPGRVHIVLQHLIAREHKLTSYSLQHVTAQVLETLRPVLSNSDVAHLLSSHEGRPGAVDYLIRATADICAIAQKLEVLPQLVEMARVTGAPLSALLNQGQQVKVLSRIARAALARGFSLPIQRKAFDDDDSRKSEYSGGAVIDASKGAYFDPTVVLDFASLYPSIMIAHNISYETLVTGDAPSGVELFEVDISSTEAPSKVSFLKSGETALLPSILEDLLAARRRAKEKMKNSAGFEKSLLNSRQLALKVTCNSLYGFCGAANGYLPCIPIAAAVTAIGRSMILRTKAFIEAELPPTLAAFGPRVVYGDTDSVMITLSKAKSPNVLNGTAVSTAPFQIPDGISCARAFGAEVAAAASRLFAPPIQLEFEKVYSPFLLFCKKRYAGLLYAPAENVPPRIDSRGLENIRRENCLLARNLYNECLERILVRGSVDMAVDAVHKAVRTLMQNGVPPSDLIMSKSLAKSYKAKTPHASLAARMMKRDSATAPQPGDRVLFVVKSGCGGKNLSDAVEDPLQLSRDGGAADVDWYVKHQLKGPLIKLFEPLLPNADSALFPDSLFSNRARQPRPPTRTGALYAYLRVEKKCIGCGGIALKKGLCGSCDADRDDCFLLQVGMIQESQTELRKCWESCTQCSNGIVCQALPHLTRQEDVHVQCRNFECSNYHSKIKAQRDLTLRQADYAEML